jgi:hypothetical protein
MKNDRIKNDRIKSDRIKKGSIKSDRIKTDCIKSITDPCPLVCAMILFKVAFAMRKIKYNARLRWYV